MSTEAMVKLLLLSLQVLKTIRNIEHVGPRVKAPTELMFHYFIFPGKNYVVCVFLLNVFFFLFFGGQYLKCSISSKQAWGGGRGLGVIDSSWQAEHQQGSTSQNKQTCAVAYMSRGDSVL